MNKKSICIFYFLIILQKISSKTVISYYLDRTFTPEKKDYLNLFIEETGKKLIYKLPILNNREVFELKICQKGTIEKIENLKGEENDLSDDQKILIDKELQNNCLNDSYNTITVLDFSIKAQLEQIPIYNIYKICVIGFTFQEAERSFLHLSNNQMRFSKNISKDERDKYLLFYYGMDQIIDLYDQAMNNDYREILNKEENRCQIDFEEEFSGFKYDKFEQKSYYHKGINYKSDFIIEYDFEQDFDEVAGSNVEFEIEDINADNVINARTKILNAMENQFVFKEKKFPKTTIDITIDTNEFEIQKGKKIAILNLKADINSGSFNMVDVIDNFDIPENSYMRFVPLICLNDLKN